MFVLQCPATPQGIHDEMLPLPARQLGVAIDVHNGARANAGQARSHRIRGGFNWPIWAAQEKGFFRENGVEVQITPTPGSVYQLVNLIDGKFDIAMTAIDNLIAYREGQGEDAKTGPDLIAVMGADQGFLKLVAVPEVKSIADLRGTTLSVDARSTG